MITGGSIQKYLVAPSVGPGQSPDQKRILEYFEGHITLFCTYMLNAVNSSMLHVTFGGKAKVWGDNCPLSQRRTALCGGCPVPRKMSAIIKLSTLSADLRVLVMLNPQDLSNISVTLR